MEAERFFERLGAYGGSQQAVRLVCRHELQQSLPIAHLPSPNDAVNPSGVCDFCQRIGVENHQIRQFAHLDAAQALNLLQCSGVIQRRHLQGRCRRDPGLHQQSQLLVNGKPGWTKSYGSVGAHQQGDARTEEPAGELLLLAEYLLSQRRVGAPVRLDSYHVCCSRFGIASTSGFS